MDNEFQDQVEEDLNINSHESATKGDLRNLALRVELRIAKAESSLKDQMNTTGWKFVGATIGTMGMMFTIFAVFVTSLLK